MISKAARKTISGNSSLLKSVTDTVKELKEQVEAQDKILSKAQPKALGAESKDRKADAKTTQTQVKSVMGMIK